MVPVGRRPQHRGDEHLRSFGKIPVTVNEIGKLVPHKKPAKGYSRASLSINPQRLSTEKFLEAIKMGMYDLVVDMHCKGIDKNTTNTDGYSALMCAAAYGKTKIAQYLLENKCDLLANSKGQKDSALTWLRSRVL